MKLSFEIPFNYLKVFSKYTDYNFVLAHNLSNKKYFDFYKNSKKFTILDNSAFELLSPIEGEELLDLAQQLKPDLVIAPDVMGSCEETLEKVEKFIMLVERKKIKIKIGGVLQGKNINEYLMCYHLYRFCKNIEMICIPFDVPFNVYDLKSNSETNQWMLNRVSFLRYLGEKRLIVKEKKYHLLGASNPIEILFYGGVLLDLSMDTSSPIVHGAKGILFTEKGLPGEKIKEKLDFNMNLNKKQIKDIIFNIKKMKFWSSFVELKKGGNEWK